MLEEDAEVLEGAREYPQGAQPRAHRGADRQCASAAR